MTEQRVSNKAMDMSERVKQFAPDRVTLTLSDAVAAPGLSLTVKTHLKAGVIVK